MGSDRQFVGWMRRVGTALALAALLPLLGCGGSHSTPPARGSVRVAVEWPTEARRAIPFAARSVRFTLTSNADPNNPRTLVLQRPTSQGVFNDVPVGPASLESIAYGSDNGEGTPLAGGSVPVDVSEGTQDAPEFAIESTVTDWVVAPETVDVEVGKTVQLTASGRNAAGQAVMLPQPAWSITTGAAHLEAANSRATTEYTWTVRGVSEGTATVSATVEEAEGQTHEASATVTVVPAATNGTGNGNGGDNGNGNGGDNGSGNGGDNGNGGTVPAGALRLDPAERSVLFDEMMNFQPMVGDEVVDASLFNWSLSGAPSDVEIDEEGVLQTGTTRGTFEVRAAVKGEASRSATATVTIEGAGGGPLEGTVVDENGAAVSGALVTTAGEEVRTDSQGRFVFEDPPLGHRIFQISAPGYATQLVEYEHGIKDPAPSGRWFWDRTNLGNVPLQKPEAEEGGYDYYATNLTIRPAPPVYLEIERGGRASFEPGDTVEVHSSIEEDYRHYGSYELTDGDDDTSKILTTPGSRPGKHYAWVDAMLDGKRRFTDVTLFNSGTGGPDYTRLGLPTYTPDDDGSSGRGVVKSRTFLTMLPQVPHVVRVGSNEYKVNPLSSFLEVPVRLESGRNRIQVSASLFGKLFTSEPIEVEYRPNLEMTGAMWYLVSREIDELGYDMGTVKLTPRTFDASNALLKDMDGELAYSYRGEDGLRIRFGFYRIVYGRYFLYSQPVGSGPLTSLEIIAVLRLQKIYTNNMVAMMISHPVSGSSGNYTETPLMLYRPPETNPYHTIPIAR